jgi:hypothetical protein
LPGLPEYAKRRAIANIHFFLSHYDYIYLDNIFYVKKRKGIQPPQEKWFGANKASTKTAT